MKTVIYKKLDKKLQDDWEALWRRVSYANYVNSPQWFLSVVEAFRPKDYVIIATYDSNKLVAVGALVEEKRYGVNVFATAPADFVCGMPFLVDFKNKKILAAFLDGVRKIGSVILDNVSDDGAMAIKRAMKNTDLIPYSLNYYLKLEKDSKGEVLIRNRKKLIRQIRNIESEFVLKNFNGIDTGVLKNVFELDNKSRKHKRGYSAFSDKKIKIFFELLAKKYAEVLTVNILYFRNQPIAYEMGYLVGNTYFGNQMAFVEDYSRYYPGKVLIVKLIDSLNTKGVRRFDLGSGDNFLKRSLTTDYSKLYKVIISDNIFLRIYVTNVYKYKDKVYNLLKENTGAYSFYKKLRKFIGT